MKLFKINSQQFFNIEDVSTVDDLGWDILVKLKTGREFRVGGELRLRFEAIIKPFIINP